MSKYSMQKRNNDSTLSLFDALDDFFKPVFFDEYSFMRTDVKETKDGYHIDIEMPGFKKDEISVTLEDGYLTVAASKKATEENGEKYIKREISQNYQRSYYVGDDVTEEQIKAKYADGILALEIPKSQPKQIKSRSINID